MHRRQYTALWEATASPLHVARRVLSDAVNDPVWKSIALGSYVVNNLFQLFEFPYFARSLLLRSTPDVSSYRQAHSVVSRFISSMSSYLLGYDIGSGFALELATAIFGAVTMLFSPGLSSVFWVANGVLSRVNDFRTLVIRTLVSTGATVGLKLLQFVFNYATKRDRSRGRGRQQDDNDRQRSVANDATAAAQRMRAGKIFAAQQGRRNIEDTIFKMARSQVGMAMRNLSAASEEGNAREILEPLSLDPFNAESAELRRLATQVFHAAPMWQGDIVQLFSQ
jgi:hypothetical protein